MISFSGKTGALTLTQGWETRNISFDQGRICYVAAGAILPRMYEFIEIEGVLIFDMFEVRRASREGSTTDELPADPAESRSA